MTDTRLSCDEVRRVFARNLIPVTEDAIVTLAEITQLFGLRQAVYLVEVATLLQLRASPGSELPHSPLPAPSPEASEQSGTADRPPVSAATPRGTPHTPASHPGSSRPNSASAVIDRGSLADVGNLLMARGLREAFSLSVESVVLALGQTPADPAHPSSDAASGNPVPSAHPTTGNLFQAKPLQRAILEVQRLVAELSPIDAPWVGSAIYHLGKIRGYLEMLNRDTGKDYESAALKK